jgi:hypothetical protein
MLIKQNVELWDEGAEMANQHTGGSFCRQTAHRGGVIFNSLYPIWKADTKEFHLGVYGRIKNRNKDSIFRLFQGISAYFRIKFYFFKRPAGSDSSGFARFAGEQGRKTVRTIRLKVVPLPVAESQGFWTLPFSDDRVELWFRQRMRTEGEHVISFSA